MTDVLDDRRESLESEEDDKAAKKLKKAEKMSETRQLDPWERYRALNDLLDTYVDMMEIADRKTRFSLVILGALNALNLVVAARPTLFAGAEGAVTGWVGVYAALYIAVSLYLVTQAIGALRPRGATFLGRVEEAGTAADGLPGLRFIGNARTAPPEQYYEAWRHAEVGQLNRELALFVQGMARVNTEKYVSLNRLFTGLTGLAFLTATLVLLLVYHALRG
jgi:hypothetical protein